MKITFEGTIDEFMKLFGEEPEKKRDELKKKNLSEFSQYARVFDDECFGWTKDPKCNIVFLVNQQNYFNDLLRTKGHVFLNEVYDALGIPRTSTGKRVGWIYDTEQPNGDNYVDFGIFDIYELGGNNIEFINGYTPDVILDFNVDGEIIDKI